MYFGIQIIEKSDVCKVNMIIVELLYNLAVLVSISVFSGFFDSRFNRNELTGKLVQGILFGTTSIIGMMYPFVLSEGIIFDGRSIVISLCTFFFGPLSGLIAASMSIVYRVFLGGGGVLMGVLVITSSFVIGYIFYRFRMKRAYEKITYYNLYSFGLAVHAVMLVFVLTLPSKSIAEAYQTISITVIGFYPLVTVVIGKILSDQYENSGFVRKLKESEKRYRSFFERNIAGTYLSTIDGKLLDCNSSFAKILGYDSVEDILKIHTSSLYPGEGDRNKFLDHLNKNKSLINNEIKLRKKDGTEITCLENVVSVLESDGVVNQFQGYIIDISERKRMENELERTKTHYQKLIENAPDGIVLITLDGKFKFASSSARKMFGFTDEEVYTQNPNELTHPDDLPNVLAALNNLIADPSKVQSLQYRFKHKNGSWIWIESTFTNLLSEPSIEAIIINFRNVSEKKYALDALEEREELYRKLIETSPDSITVCDLAGNITFASNKALELFGHLSQAEVVGRNILEWISPADYARALQHVKTIITKGGHVHEEFVLIRKDNTNFWAEISGAAIQAPDKTIKGLIIITRDISERKLVEKALRESESSYRGLFNSVSEAIYVLNEEGIFIDVNDGALKMYGYSKEELVGKTPEFVSAEGRNDLPAVAKMLNAAYQGENQIFEFWGKKKNNSAFLKEVRLYSGTYFSKRVTIALAQDITERKKSEIIQKIQYNIADAVVSTKNITQLFSSIRNELSKIINVKNFFIAQYDEHTGMLRSDIDEDEMEKISEWPAENSMTGYVIQIQKALLLTKAEILKLIDDGEANMIGIIPEVWLGVPFKILGKVVGVLVVQSYENVNEYDDSSKKLLEIVAHELSLFIQHKKTEEQTLKLSTAVEQSPATIVITNLKGEIEYVNPKFTEVTGYTFEEVKGKNPRVLNSGLKSKDEYKELWELIVNGKAWQGEFHNRKKNGELFWESATISPIMNSSGEITNFIAIKEDITVQKKLTEELISAKEKAEEMNRIKSYFYANMSHELRTPFVGILGYSELLSESLTNPEQKEMANQILASSRRLTDTLNKVLNITKLEFDKIEPKLSEINLQILIKDIQSLFVASVKQKNTELLIEYNYDSEMIKTDEKLLREILINLVNNAVKFTSNGVIKVSVHEQTEDQKSFVVIKVTDTGLGIPAAKQQIIWDEFRQASEGFNRSFEGTGLGLTLVKKYTEIIGGNISLESEVGKGSVFSVKLPIHKNGEEQLHETKDGISIESASKDSTRVNSEHILYVEDDVVSQEFVKVVLSRIDYKVQIASDAEEALRMINVNKYDAFLIDVNLGHGMDGLELTQQIRQRKEYEDIPIVAVTAFAAETDKAIFLSKGFSHYLCKPFSIEELKTTLLDALTGDKTQS